MRLKFLARIQIMSQKLPRTAQLKVIKYKSGRKKFTPKPIHEYLSQISQNALNVGQRHSEIIVTGGTKFACFYNNLKISTNKKVVAFEFCTYLPGAVPSQMLPDLTKQNISHDTTPIIDKKTSKQKEIVHIVEVVACGDILIIESVKGSGGLSLLGHYLTEQMRKHIDQKLPRLVLEDLVENSLSEAIARGNGVRELEMGLLRTATPKTSKFAVSLSKLFGDVGDTTAIQVSFSANNGKLSDKDVTDAFNECDKTVADGISKVRLHLNDGSVINGFSKYKVRKLVHISDIGGKSPNRHELRREFTQYLKELQTVKNGKRIIDSSGQLIKH